MGVKQIRKACRLLRHGGEDNHTIQETDNYPIDLVLYGRSASVPTEQRESRNTNE